MLNTGVTNRIETTVTPENIAGAVGSGSLEVFATPQMINLMEMCACLSVAPFLEQGQTTVGTNLSVSHLSATPIGMKVWCESTLTSIDGRRLVFDVKAFDEKGLIGEGSHERFIVNIEKFMARTLAKLEG
ncbi:MAG: thioesterase family protein [Clostridia bacterium]|nr:thioesterase family protein [Clostridia bacterium]